MEASMARARTPKAGNPVHQHNCQERTRGDRIKPRKGIAPDAFVLGVVQHQIDPGQRRDGQHGNGDPRDPAARPRPDRPRPGKVELLLHRNAPQREDDRLREATRNNHPIP